MCRVSYKYRLYPTKSQETKLNTTLNLCRRVYNRCLVWRKASYDLTGKSPSYLEQKRCLPILKGEEPEFETVHSQVLQDSVRRVDKAFDAFFRRVKLGEEPGYPRYKGKGCYDSITYPQIGGFSVEGDRLRLAKLGTFKIKLHRPLNGVVKTCTIRRHNGKWYACFSLDVEPRSLPESPEEVGIDVGLKHFATLDNGETIPNPRFFRKEEKNLASAQRKKESLKKGSPERRKATKVETQIHERIRNRRHDFVHRETHRLVNRFGKLFVEKLEVVEMVKGNPHCLNKSIADASWSMFRSVLRYKAENAGRVYVEVDPAYTSQDCSKCGTRLKKKLSDRVHVCPDCSLVLDRDRNAALNILARGLSCIGTQSLEAPGFIRGE